MMLSIWIFLISDVLNLSSPVLQAVFLRTAYNKLYVLAQRYELEPPPIIRDARHASSSLEPGSANKLVLVDLKVVLRFDAFTGDLTVLG